MNKKGFEGGPMWMVAVAMFVVIALVVLIYTFFGPGQLWAKSSKPIGETAGGLTSDCDNDGTPDTIDRCPCGEYEEPDKDGRCTKDASSCKKDCEKKLK